MTYQLAMRETGWEIVDTVSRSLASFGGLRLEGLTIEEAHVMVGMLQAYERGLDVEAVSEMRAARSKAPPASRRDALPA